MVCHGVPNLRPLQEGDFINLDVTVFVDEVYGDTSDMAVVGTPHPEVERLISATREAVREGIKVCGPGIKMKEVGAACEAVAEKHGFAICHEFVGHGIGRHMHMPPPVYHTRNDLDFTMKPGMVFTIEPILITSAKYELQIWKDGWTVVDRHRNPSAQAEHMVLITETGCEVLTERGQSSSK